MNDLISRQAAIDAVEYITSSMSVCVNSDECHGMKRMQRQAVIELANLSSAERKKGEWILKPNIYGVAYCSECDYELHTDNTNFCPNCGADMRGEEK